MNGNAPIWFVTMADAKSKALVGHDGPAVTVMGAIISLAQDPSVDVTKLDALLKMQERMEARQAEISFSRALAELPSIRVKKNGTVDLGPGKGSYPFARWEDIDRIVAPLLKEAGFRLAFNSEARPGDGGGLIVHGTLLHRDGHSMKASMPLALDTGPGRNNLQAQGSTLSYGKRYCAEMLLNIVREGEDTDGVMSDPITEDDIADLTRMLAETKSNVDRFLTFMGVTAIPDIQQKDLAKAKNAIARKRGAA
jgi:ERF superfamily